MLARGRAVLIVTPFALSQARIARLTCSAIGAPVLSLIVCNPSINSGSSRKAARRLGGVTTEALYHYSYTFSPVLATRCDLWQLLGTSAAMARRQSNEAGAP